MNVKEQKRALRKEILVKREALDPQERKMADMAMADRIITMRSGKVIQIAVNDNPIPVERLEW